MEAAAVPTPSPAPALETLLASPPAPDYQVKPRALGLSGTFGVDQYISFLGPKDVDETTSTLRRDGFVSGFSQTWIQEASNHLLVEFVIAFGGKAGAEEWLGKSKQTDTKDAFYKNPISVPGLESYYGARFADPTRALYADIVSFVKGNDYFVVGLVSGANDLADLASRQTRRQFDKAPPYTIPPAQWPESAGSLAIGPLLVPAPVAVAGASALALALLALAGAAGFLVWRRRRPVAATSGAGPPAGIPAGALRSDDGHRWWDGERWRPVAPPGEPPSS